jgi:hypothetical protein
MVKPERRNHMKLVIASATTALLYAGLGMAQMQGEKPVATDTPGMTIVTGNESKHAREADARHCLVVKNDLEIIRCAEKYRYSPVAKKSGA